MFKRIIVPLDGTARAEKALALATDLARKTGVDLLLICVAPPVEDRETYLRKLTADLDVPSETKVFGHGRPADRIVDCMRQHQAALVVMATHRHRPLGTAVLGSVGAQVVRDSGGEVMLIGPHYEHRGTPSCVVLPLDGSQYADTARRVAVALSAQLGIPLQLVEVVDPNPRGEWLGIPLDERIIEGGYLATVDARLEGRSHSWDVLHDHHPAYGIVSYVDRMPGAPVVVMATHGRTGRALVTVGSVATQVLHRATFPVVLIRPEGLFG